MKVILWLAFGAMALAADGGFDSIRMVQEREARAQRDRAKTAAAKPAAVIQEDAKRAERLAALEKQITEWEAKRDGGTK